MRVLGILILLMAAPAYVGAAETGAKLDAVRIDLQNGSSLQRGARMFVNYCLSCHSAAYMRYNRLGRDLGISDDLIAENLMFASEKVGDLMTTTMPREQAKQWFGVAPPDLSTIARVRKPSWLYTYLRGFYVDDAAPSGWNNVVFSNVAMPHVLHELQGVQRAVFDEGGNFQEFEIEKPGVLSTAEFDAAIQDLTNFLVYLAEPAKLERYAMGTWVILFLIVLAGLSYLLKKEYWRDVH